MTFPKKFKSFAKNKGGARSGGGFKKKSFGDSDRGDVEMHSAVCAKCNNRCQVPFKPNGRKPIFCSNCFVKDEFAPKSFNKGSGFDRPSFTPATSDRTAEQLKMINVKLDAILKALAE